MSFPTHKRTNVNNARALQSLSVGKHCRAFPAQSAPNAAPVLALTIPGEYGFVYYIKRKRHGNPTTETFKIVQPS